MGLTAPRSWGLFAFFYLNQIVKELKRKINFRVFRNQNRPVQPGRPGSPRPHLLNVCRTTDLHGRYPGGQQEVSRRSAGGIQEAGGGRQKKSTEAVAFVLFFVLCMWLLCSRRVIFSCWAYRGPARAERCHRFHWCESTRSQAQLSYCESGRCWTYWRW